MDEGLRVVSKLKALTSLDIDGSNVTNKGLRAIKRKTALTRLDLGQCWGVTDKGVWALQTALPKLKILDYTEEYMRDDDGYYHRL
jgi:hypothetical protein